MATPFEHEYQASSHIEAAQEGIASPRELLLIEDSYEIGRSSRCQMVVQHPLASRQHARIERDGERYVLVDIGSANGTFVNGEPLEGSHLLRHDDRIGLGIAESMLRFVDPDSTVRSAGRIRFNSASALFTISGAIIQLPPVQYRLLLHLYDHRGEVCTRDECAQAMWGRGYDPAIDAGAFDQAISSLRRILRTAANSTTDPIHVYRGRGYSLRA